MKKLSGIFLFVLFLFLFITSFTTAQQWSDEQKAVWAGVEKYWEAGMSSDPTNFLSYFDDTYHGWNYQNGAPTVKTQLTKIMSYWFKKGQTKLYTITPLTIWVNGDFAYVHYYYTMVNEGSEGKPMPERGRWTDILMMKDGKWMLVGDHGGEMDDD